MINFYKKYPILSTFIFTFMFLSLVFSARKYHSHQIYKFNINNIISNIKKDESNEYICREKEAIEKLKSLKQSDQKELQDLSMSVYAAGWKDKIEQLTNSIKYYDQTLEQYNPTSTEERCKLINLSYISKEKEIYNNLLKDSRNFFNINDTVITEIGVRVVYPDGEMQDLSKEIGDADVYASVRKLNNGNPIVNTTLLLYPILCLFLLLTPALISVFSSKRKVFISAVMIIPLMYLLFYLQVEEDMFSQCTDWCGFEFMSIYPLTLIISTIVGLIISHRTEKRNKEDMINLLKEANEQPKNINENIIK